MRKKIKLLALVGLIVLAVFILNGIEICTSEMYICSICGSTRWQIVWRFGYTGLKGYQTSSLEQWLIDHKKGHTHQWVKITGNHQNIFGFILFRQHALPPAIYGFSNFLDEFVTQASEKEIDEFVHLMTSGSEEEKYIKVEEIANSILDAAN